MSGSQPPAHTDDPSPNLKPAAVIELEGHDLPAFCPNPKMPMWSSHPRVFLDVADKGEALCPYCGNLYRLKPGAVVKAHH